MTWLHRTIDRHLAEQHLPRLLELGLLSDHHPSVIVHDLAELEARCRHLKATFPPNTLHTLAVKANPLPAALRRVVQAGLGLEAASLGEIALARQAGCPDHKIVFDSPAKTRTELAEIAATAITINCNSSVEVARLDNLSRNGPVGLRVNPAVADDSRASTTMVATRDSKFGVPIEEARDTLQRFPWLQGLHIHVGSQVATADDLIASAVVVTELAREHPQIEWLDIGGGLPTRYRSSDQGLTPQDYLNGLKRAVPDLMEYRLLTEMGRAVQANCGYALTRVEYVKENRAIVHLGADFALRECYQPESWYHDLEVFDSNGKAKTGITKDYDLYGPLCFSGDRLAQRRALPRLEEGDIVAFHDCGAYTLSMWSRYCSRPMPEIIGWTGEQFETLRTAEQPEDVVRFWEGPK